MSSAQVDRATKLNNSNKKENEKARKPFNPTHKKYKHEDNRHFKFGRKRLQTFPGNGKFFPPHKRRKKEDAIIPPTKFLLGGNICDPLNLNSMQDEEINRAMNAVTPKSSPLPIPKHRKEAIEVIIPPNICDPLNLSNCNDNEEYEKQLISPTKKNSKKRNRNKKKRALSFSGNSETTVEIGEQVEKQVENKDVPTEKVVEVEEKIPVEKSSPTREMAKEPKVESPVKDKAKLRLKVLEESKDKRLRKLDAKDKIVSPVIPQPGAWKPRLTHRPSQDKKKKPQQMPKFKPQDAKFQYGNYNRYYGYRNLNLEVDPRLKVFIQRKEMFFDKDILDIGCNIGHITLSVGRDLSPRSVTGIDIDKDLITIARKNIKHYVNFIQSPASTEDGSNNKETDPNFFPLSMPISYGPIDIPGFIKDKSHKGFPYNVSFVQGNYVLEDDSLLSLEQPQFDSILCLSTTKWIHLNFGDNGLKQSFKRMFAQLRPGGVLILEAQNWNSYGKKKSRTERIFRNYENIRFFPNQFTQYLLSAEVGFSKCEVISMPSHSSKGFQRPLHLFTKTDLFESPPVRTACATNDCQNDGLVNFEQQVFDVDLFPADTPIPGSSQRSNGSMSTYEQLENIYCPTGTPLYLQGTPAHLNDSTSTSDNNKHYYAEIEIERSPIPASPEDNDKVSDKQQDNNSNIDDESAEKNEGETSNLESTINKT